MPVSRALIIALAIAAAVFAHPARALAEATQFSYDARYKFITSMFSTNGTLTVRGPLRYDKVVRWEVPIRIAFYGDVQKKDEQTILSSLNRLSEATPLRFTLGSATPNFILLFVSDARLQRAQVLAALAKIYGDEIQAKRALDQFPDLTSSAQCTMASTNTAGRIQMYIGVIRKRDAPSLGDRCIELQIMAGVGFHAYDMSDLYNRKYLPVEKVQSTQLEMVRLLYSDRLYPGQRFEEVKKLLLGF